MLVGGGESDLEAWKLEMRQYEKAKRTKKPFGPTFPTVSHVTHKDIKTQETQFNPVLQTYKEQQAEEAVNRREEQKRAQSLASQFVRDRRLRNTRTSTKSPTT